MPPLRGKCGRLFRAYARAGPQSPYAIDTNRRNQEGPDGPGPCGRLPGPAAAGSSTASGSLRSPVRNAPEPAAIPPARPPRGHTLRALCHRQTLGTPPIPTHNPSRSPRHNPEAARLPAPQASRTSPALTALPTRHVLPRPNGSKNVYISLSHQGPYPTR